MKYTAIEKALDYVATFGGVLEPGLVDDLESIGIKTYDYYRKIFVSAVNALYNDKITVNEFTDKLSTLIYNQLFAAWREGMVDNGLDPKADFTQAMADEISKMAAQEVEHLRTFGNDIVAARVNENLGEVQSRADIWSSRYDDVRDRARLATAKKDKRFKWVVGDTEHCVTCLGLKDIVATAADWATLEARGIYPKSPNLDCHGYRCQCERVPTDDPLTEGGIPSV
jgi:hypothetical protein